jgi:hypothetical protein
MELGSWRGGRRGTGQATNEQHLVGSMMDLFCDEALHKGGGKSYGRDEGGKEEHGRTRAALIAPGLRRWSALTTTGDEESHGIRWGRKGINGWRCLTGEDKCGARGSFGKHVDVKES